MQPAITEEDVREFARQFVAAEPIQAGNGDWWQTPLVVTGSIDNRYSDLGRIAATDHLLPKDLLTSAKSVIVFFIPFKKSLVKENQKKDRPCRNWAVAYVQTNDLIGRLTQALGDLLSRYGYESGLTPATHNFDDIKLMARWSHKHLGHLAGLGRFGTHHMLITPAGCAGRLGSLVTEADLGDHPLIETEEACLLKAGKACGKCIQACPVSAISDDEFDRRGCWNRLNDNYRSLTYMSDLPDSTHVCGKCAAMMPCSFKNPVTSL